MAAATQPRRCKMIKKILDDMLPWIMVAVNAIGLTLLVLAILGR